MTPNVNNKQEDAALLLQSSPHMGTPVTSVVLMRNVLIALAPVSIFGVLIFGMPALFNIITGIVSAVAGESLFRLITKQKVRVKDLSAVVSGLILALILPPTTPPWITALGAVFAIVVGKEFFGGLGANVFNPALVGRAFLLMSFPAVLTTWRYPVLPIGAAFSADVITGATPLAITKMGDGIAGVGRSLVEAGLSSSDSYWAVMQTVFFGFNGGSMGETSAFLILAAFLFLLVTKTVSYKSSLSMIGAGFICALAFWQDPLFALFSVLSGGFLFGAVFMVTDYATSPVTGKGKIVFGCGVGIITMLIRRWGLYPEGVLFAILIMNAVVPFLNRLVAKKYGYVKPVKPAKKG